MNSRLSQYRRVIGGSAAAVVLMGGGIGIGVAVTGGASAATGSAATGSAATGSAATGRPAATGPRRPCAGQRPRRADARLSAARLSAAHCRPRLHRMALLGGIHGQVTFKAKTGFRTIAFERGSVQSVSGSAVTVRAADGTTWTWHLVQDSVIRENGGKIAVSKLAAGEQVLVAGPVVSGQNDVKLIRIRPAG
jgi:hypothetical protein